MNVRKAQNMAEETMNYLINCGDVFDVYNEPEELIHETAEITRCFIEDDYSPIIERIWEVMPEDRKRKSYGELYTDWEYLMALLNKVEHLALHHTKPKSDGFIIIERF